MADTEVIKVLFEIANPTVLSQIEQLRRAPLNLNINTITDNKLKELLDIKDRKIDVRFSANNDSINKLQERIKELTKPVVVNITAKDNFDEIEAKFQRAFVKSKGINAVGYTRAEVASVATDPLLNKVLGTFPAGGSKPTISQIQSQSAKLNDIIIKSTNDQIQQSLKQIGVSKIQQGFVPVALDDVKKVLNKPTEDARTAAIQKYRLSGGEFSDINANRDRLAREAALRTRQAEEAAERIAKIKEVRGDFLREATIGALRGEGLPALGGSILGGLAGGAFGGIKGVSFGSAAGGAAVEGAIHALEGLKDVFIDITHAGLEFQKTIVSISSVLQANTTVFGENGKPLSVLEQVQYNTKQATQIQKAARSELLPLGIGGEAEATLVQGLISGFSQRGIVLTPDQTKVISKRIGSAVVSLTPQLLGNPTQERKDIEDIAAGSPNAKRTTLGVALQSIAPDLFRPLASGQEIIKATERLEQFNQAIRNSDQASVQVLRLSGAIDKLRTTAGDALLQGLEPGIKALADTLDSEGINTALEGLGKSLGLAGSVLIKFGLEVGKFVEGLISKFPLFQQVGNLLKLFAQGPAAAVQGFARPNPEIAIAGSLRGLGIESPSGDLEKLVASNATYRQNKLSDVESLISIEGDKGIRENLQDKFLPLVLDESIKALELRSKERAGTFDSGTFSGRKSLAEFQGNVASEKFDIAKRGFDIFSQRAQAAEGTPDQARLEAIADTFKNTMDQASREITDYSKAVVVADLDQVKSLQSLRNAQEQLADTQKNQVLQLNELNRSLQEAKDSVSTFSSKIASAFASREEQILQAAKEVETAGGDSGIADLDSKLKQAKLKGAATKFNELLADTGLTPNVEARFDTGITIPQAGSPFTNRLDAEREKLTDSISSITDELERLPRALRDAVENLADLTTRTGQQFEGGNIPSLLSVTSANLPEYTGKKPSKGEKSRFFADYIMKAISPDLEPIKFGGKETPFFSADGVEVYTGGVESPLTSAASISGLSTSGDIFDRDLFGEDKSLRRAGPIPNISDLKNVTPSTSGRQIYEGITHGLMDSNSREFSNRHPKYPSDVSVSSAPAGGKEANPQNDLASAIRDNTKAAQDNFQKLESTIKKALESAFGG